MEPECYIHVHTLYKRKITDKTTQIQINIKIELLRKQKNVILY